jgi:hypothetical protein
MVGCAKPPYCFYFIQDIIRCEPRLWADYLASVFLKSAESFKDKDFNSNHSVPLSPHFPQFSECTRRVCDSSGEDILVQTRRKYRVDTHISKSGERKFGVVEGFPRYRQGTGVRDLLDRNEVER